MEKQKVKNMSNILMIITALFCISFSIGLIYKFFQPKKNINEKDVYLISSEKNFNFMSDLAVTDQFGKTIDESSSSYVFGEIELKNKSYEDREYQLYITKYNLADREIGLDYVKFYLTDENNNPIGVFTSNKIPTYNALSYIEDKPASKLIYSGKINKDSTEKLKLRVWIADNYVISAEKKFFSFSISVRAV